MTERKMLMTEVDTVDLDGYTLKDAIRNLTELMAQHGDEAKVSKEEYAYQDSTSQYWAVMKPVPETDIEMASRIVQERNFKLYHEECDRKEFARLQAKFGAVK